MDSDNNNPQNPQDETNNPAATPTDTTVQVSAQTPTAAPVKGAQTPEPQASNQSAGNSSAGGDGHISKGESAKYIVKVDQNLCIGAASCVALAPKIFQLNSENKAYVVDPNGDTEENLKAAAQSCPVNAIILENKETGQQEYP